MWEAMAKVSLEIANREAPEDIPDDLMGATLVIAGLMRIIDES